MMFYGDAEDGETLRMLKKQLLDCSTIKKEQVDEFRQIALSSKFCVGTRVLAAQVFVRAGGTVDLENCHDEALICGAILEWDVSDIRKLLNWLCSEAYDGSIALHRSALYRLQHYAKNDYSSNVDAELSQTFLKALSAILRGLLVRSASSYDARQLNILLQLQRKYGLTASEQFELILSFSTAMKQKFPMLAFVIPALKPVELKNLEYKLADALWTAQRRQPSATLTMDCALAWAVASLDIPESLFLPFVADALSSYNKVRRSSCSRFWLARFGARSELQGLLRKLADLLQERIQNEHLCEFAWPLSKAEMRELSCIDREWRWKENEEVWSRTNCTLSAWTAVFGILAKHKQFIPTENDRLILHVCLRSCHSSVRLQAFHAFLLVKQKLSVTSDELFKSSDAVEEEFILNNLGTSDVLLRELVLRSVSSPSFKSGRLFRQKIIAQITDDANEQTAGTSLKILQRISSVPSDGLDIDKLLNLISDERVEIRRNTVSLLPSCIDEKVTIFIENELIRSVKRTEEDFERVPDLCRALLKYRSFEYILSKINESESSCSYGILRCLYSLLDCNRDRCKENLGWINKCLEINDRMLLLSGSSKVGQCSSFVELTRRLAPNGVSHKVFLCSQHSINVVAYYYSLRSSCELLTLFCRFGNISLALAEKSLDSVWNVLLRSRHKGVVDHVSDSLLSIADGCLKIDGFLNVLTDYLNKTKSHFVDENVSARNLSFSAALRCFAERTNSLGPLISFLLEAATSHKSVIAVRALKSLKNILNAAELDLSEHHLLIFKTLSKLFRSSDWVVRSSILHCFAVLVSRMIVDDGESGYPLYAFMASRPAIWLQLCESVVQAAAFDMELMLYLSLAEKLRLVHVSLYTPSQLRSIRSFTEVLVALLLLSKNIRLSRTIINCLVHLCPRTEDLRVRLSSLLNRNISTNLRCAIEYAVDKITCELYGLPPLSFDENLHTLKSSNQFILSNAAGPFLRGESLDMGALLNGVEADVLSAKELLRLRSAHFLVLLAPHIYESSREHQNRFFCYASSLLMDEVESITRVSSRISLHCSDSQHFYSSSPVNALKDLARNLVQNGNSASQLLLQWRDWSTRTNEKRRKYNRFFMDSYVENLLKGFL